LAILSIIVLLCFVLLIWIARKKHSRFHWLLSSMGGVIAWLASFFLLGKAPLTTSLSIWRPESLFPTPLAFSFNQISSLLGFSVLGMIVTMTFIEPGLERSSKWIEKSFLLIYFSISLAALFVENILTVVVVWMLMDSALFLYLLPLSERFIYRRRITAWYLKGILSILMLVSSAGIHFEASQMIHIGSDSMQATVPLFILGACLLRLPWIRISLPRRSMEQELTELELASYVLPSVAALSLLEWLFRAWNDQRLLGASRLIGGVLVVVALLMLFFGSSYRIHQVGYVIFLCWGIALLMLTNGSLDNTRVIMAMGYLMVFLPLVISNIKIFEPWQRAIILVAILAALGIPGMPGYHMGEMVVTRMRAGQSIGSMILAIIGMGVMAYAVYRTALLRVTIPTTREKFAQLSHSFGLVAMPLTGLIIAAKGQIVATMNGAIFSLSAGAIFALMYFVDHKIKFESMDQFRDRFLDATRRIRVPHLEKILVVVVHLIRSMTEVFEGETGVLWILVILQILILAFGRLLA
jgi:hypothetical protein